MLTSKQRATLRGMANQLSPVYQIGKSAITEELIKGISDCLESKELIKINVLQNCDYTAKELANEIGELTNSDVVSVVGNKIVLYRESKKKKKNKIEIWK